MEEIQRNLSALLAELERVQRREVVKLNALEQDDGEYHQLIRNIWIGCILTLIVVSCVVCLCSCLTYHRFRTWKRRYDARSEVRHGPVGAGALSADIDTLPNYTLVSGLPTYDDALEQLRLSTSTNHLLINHQTFMKLFGSTQPVITSKDTKDLKETKLYVDEQPLPCYDEVVGAASATSKGPPSVASEDTASEFISDGSSASSSARTSTVSTVDSHRLSTDTIALSRPTAHRFTCTAVPTLPIELNSRRMVMLRNERRRASDVPSPRFKRQTSTPVPNRPLHLIDSSSSLGSLNIINEIRRNNTTDTPHASSMWNIDSHGLAQTHRGSLY